MDRFVLYRKNPFEKFVVMFLVFGCTASLVVGAKPGSVQTLMPGWWWHGWLAVTLLGALAYLYGIYTRDLQRGLFTTYAVSPIIAVATGALGAAQFYYAGVNALIGGGLVLGITVAFLNRRKQLGEIVQALPKKIGPPK